MAGERVKVSWSAPVNGNDRVTIVPVGSPDDEGSEHVAMRDRTERKITATGTTGLCELRHALRQGGRVPGAQGDQGGMGAPAPHAGLRGRSVAPVRDMPVCANARP